MGRADPFCEEKGWDPSYVYRLSRVEQVDRENRYPLPIDDLFDLLEGAAWFSRIDLKSGYVRRGGLVLQD